MVALACAPIMLLVKPLILKRQLAHCHEEEAGHNVEVHSEKIEYQMVGGKEKLISSGNDQMD